MQKSVSPFALGTDYIMQSQMNPNVAFQPQQIQHSNQPRFVVVNETPPAQRLTFPINFREKQVLGISVAKIVIGSIQLVAGIANIFFLPFFTSIIAFPIWCGLLVRLFFLFNVRGVVLHIKYSLRQSDLL